MRNIDALNDGDLSEYKLEEIQFEENKNKDIDHAENKQILINNQNLVVEKPKKKYVKKTTKK